jgi:hypothetical protein
MQFFVKLGRQGTDTAPLWRFLRFRSKNGFAFSPGSAQQGEDAPALNASPSHNVSRNALSDIFALDVRSLALLRVSLALVIIADLLARSVDLRAHYTDVGLLPRSIAVTEYAQYGFLSLHFLGGTVITQSVLFLIAAFCAVGLFFGYRTRLMTVLSWLLLISLHNRNPMILDAGDVLLRMLLFWSMFLPLGATYSLDGVLTNSPARHFPTRIVSIASIALILQVCFVYWFTVALKHDPVWRSEGSGVYYALNLDSFATAIGLWLREFQPLLPLLSFATLAMEALGPCLLFIPFVQGPLRFLTVCMFLGLHLGLALCLALGVFPFIVGAAWLALLPTWFWHRLRLPRDFSQSRKFRLQHRLESLLGAARYQRFAVYAHPPVWHPTFVGVIFCVICLGYVFLWNVRTINFEKYSAALLSAESNWFGQTLRIDQMWGMFAPKPATDDGWYVIPARLRDGSEFDLATNSAPVDWTKPVDVAARFHNQRWRKYLRNIWERDHANHRLYYGQYLCRTWNATHHGKETLENFQVFYMKEETRPGGNIAPPEKVMLWTHRCF